MSNKKEKDYRKYLDEIANQLCRSVDDDLNFTVSTSSSQHEFQKLAMLINFVLDNCRRNMANLKTLQHDLGVQKAKLDAVTLVSETDLKGIITYANDVFCRTAKYKKEEVLGKTHRIINSGHHSKSFWKQMWSTIASGNIWRGEVCNRAKDGEIYWVDAQIMPNHDAENNIVGYTAVRVDITERKLADAQLQHTSKLASVGELAAGVGHEINNPLAIAMGNIERIRKTLISAGHWNEKLAKNFEKHTTACLRIKNIVNGLRTFSRVDSDEAESLDLHKVTQQSLELLKEIFDKQGVEVHYDPPSEPIYVRGAFGKVQQVVFNLLQNAKDAIESKSGGEGEIFINIDSQPNSITLSIRDTGGGIPKTIQDKIFNTFFTTKEAGKGTGLGLGIVSKIMAEFGGSIRFDSIDDVGTTFFLTFPCSDSAPTEETASDGKLRSRKRLSGRALLVEDEAGLRELFKEMLESFGLEVTTAENGLEAIEKIRSEPLFHYVITDLKMRKMNGIQLIHEAKKLVSDQTKFFIVTGGLNDDENKSGEKSIWGSADGYIFKPFTEEELYEEICRVVFGDEKKIA